MHARLQPSSGVCRMQVLAGTAAKFGAVTISGVQTLVRVVVAGQPPPPAAQAGSPPAASEAQQQQQAQAVLTYPSPAAGGTGQPPAPAPAPAGGSATASYAAPASAPFASPPSSVLQTVDWTLLLTDVPSTNPAAGEAVKARNPARSPLIDMLFCHASPECCVPMSLAAPCRCARSQQDVVQGGACSACMVHPGHPPAAA